MGRSSALQSFAQDAFIDACPHLQQSHGKMSRQKKWVVTPKFTKEHPARTTKSSREVRGPTATSDKDKGFCFSYLVKGVAAGLDHKYLFGVASGLYKTRILKAFVDGWFKRSPGTDDRVKAMDDAKAFMIERRRWSKANGTENVSLKFALSCSSKTDSRSSQSAAIETLVPTEKVDPNGLDTSEKVAAVKSDEEIVAEAGSDEKPIAGKADIADAEESACPAGNEDIAAARVDSPAMVIVGESHYDFKTGSAIHNGETSKYFVQLFPKQGTMSAVGAKFGDDIRKVMGIWWDIILEKNEGVENAPCFNKQRILMSFKSVRKRIRIAKEKVTQKEESLENDQDGPPKASLDDPPADGQALALPGPIPRAEGSPVEAYPTEEAWKESLLKLAQELCRLEAPLKIIYEPRKTQRQVIGAISSTKSWRDRARTTNK